MTKDLDKYIKILKTFNIRMTSQRYAILEYLAVDERHPTATEIYNALKIKFPNMSLATVYNNLNFFKEAGIVTELKLKDDSSSFDLTDTDHYHAVCTNCGKIVDFDLFDMRKIEKEIERITGYKISAHEFNVSGLCEECKIKTNKFL